jgi:nucleoid-associated protein YgaU
MISADSRYRTATVQAVQTPTGPRQTILSSDPEARTISYTSYLVRDGDRIDLLAHRYLGQAALWWMIADANPEIHDWFALQTGTVLRIPSA